MTTIFPLRSGVDYQTRDGQKVTCGDATNGGWTWGHSHGRRLLRQTKNGSCTGDSRIHHLDIVALWPLLKAEMIVHEAYILCNGGIIEIMARNPNVSSWVEEMEARLAKSETAHLAALARIAELEAALTELVDAIRRSDMITDHAVDQAFNEACAALSKEEASIDQKC